MGLGSDTQEQDCVQVGTVPSRQEVNSTSGHGTISKSLTQLSAPVQQAHRGHTEQQRKMRMADRITPNPVAAAPNVARIRNTMLVEDMIMLAVPETMGCLCFCIDST